MKYYNIIDKQYNKIKDNYKTDNYIAPGCIGYDRYLITEELMFKTNWYEVCNGQINIKTLFFELRQYLCEKLYGNGGISVSLPEHVWEPDIV